MKIDIKQCSICIESKSLDEFYSFEKVNAKGENYTYYNPYCKECTINKSTNYRKTNEEFRERRKEFYKSEIHKKRRKSWRDRNKEHVEEYGQQYRQSEHGKEKYQEYGKKRKVKNHKISKEEWKNCKEYFNDECAYCGLKIENHKKKYAGELKQIDFHKEHVDDEGSNDLSNCVPSCHSCNSKKHTMKLKEWYNKNNGNFSVERLNKIIKWLEEDYKSYIR